MNGASQELPALKALAVDLAAPVPRAPQWAGYHVFSVDAKKGDTQIRVFVLDHADAAQHKNGAALRLDKSNRVLVINQWHGRGFGGPKEVAKEISGK